MKFVTDGLIIKEQSIGEQDRLVTALTGSNGVIRAFVRRAKNIKNPKCAATGLLCYSRLNVSKGRDTYSIDEASSQEMFIKLRNSVENMSLAQYFCELCIHLCPKETEAQEYLRLILNALYLLSNSLRDPLIVKACVEMRLMSMCGYLPDLVMCEHCGCYESEQMLFSPQTGKIICTDCASKHPTNGIIINRSVLTALRHTVYADFDKLFSFSLSEQGQIDLNRVSESYIRCMTDRDFSTLEFYKMIKGQGNEQAL